MKQKLIVLGIISIFLITGILSTTATSNTQNEITISNRYTFEASLEIIRNERPIINLQGSYHYRGRFIIVQGSEDNRFSGIFIGNMFIIRTQLNGRIQTIFGQYRYSEDNSFTGIWSVRFLQNRGWIEGIFI
jgi:hypothetical protein